MSVLASSLEPLVFDFVSFGFSTFVSNLWTWLALMTAALSFWRLRAAGSNSSSSSSSSSSSLDSCESSNGSTPPLVENTVSEKEPTTTSSPAPAPVASAVTSRSSEDHDGVMTKGVKFTVYYENDEEKEEEEGDGEMTVTEEKEMVEVEGGGEWWESWERMLKMRGGEICWYRYQDLTEINGNVVRLWDACRRIRPDTDSCSISKNCVVW